MKILHVIASMNPASGGTTQVLQNTIPELEKINVANEVVCLDDPKAPFLSNNALVIHALGPSRTPYVYSPRLKTWLASNLMRFNVVIIHGLWLYSSYGTYLAWKSLATTQKCELLIMPHGMLDPYFQKVKERGLFKVLRNELFYKLFERHVVNKSSGVLFTCEEELKLAFNNFKPFKPKRALNVGLGIEAPPQNAPVFQEAFYNRCPEIKEQPYLLFLSRVHPKKGVDLLLEAYLKCFEEFEHMPALVIAGPGLETAYGKEMLERAANKPIYFTGMISGAHKWGAIYNCQAFILPSHQENFGIAIVECMACHKPVLITSKINIHQEIKNGGGGLIFDDTIEATYSALKYFLNLENDIHLKMGALAYKTYETQFTIPLAAKRLKTNLLKINEN